jgi:hypothetical protein
VTRRPSRVLRASAASFLLIAAMVGGLLALGTFPAAAATVVDCPPMSSDTCKNLTPIAECAWDNKDGTTTVAWGWDNPTASTARIAVGPKNRLAPGGDNQGQPTLFAPGRKRNVFVTTFSGPASTWSLGNNDAKTDKATVPCATKPVPQVGSIDALLLFLVMLGLGVLLLAAGRQRTMAVPA